MTLTDNSYTNLCNIINGQCMLNTIENTSFLNLNLRLKSRKWRCFSFQNRFIPTGQLNMCGRGWDTLSICHCGEGTLSNPESRSFFSALLIFHSIETAMFLKNLGENQIAWNHGYFTVSGFNLSFVNVPTPPQNLIGSPLTYATGKMMNGLRWHKHSPIKYLIVKAFSSQMFPISILWRHLIQET